jgi:haloacetate dehalogenase
MCEDYRAAATVDFQYDEADRGKRKITCPLLALWGTRGQLPKWYDVLEIWRGWADDVQGHGIDSGHYLPEEAPEATYAALHAFLTG